MPERSVESGGPRVGWASVVVAAALACGTSGVVGGPCSYHSTAGIARITSVSPAPAGEYACARDPVKVLLDFTPTDATQPARTVSGYPVTVGAGAHPPSAWVTASGLTVASEHPAVRKDITSGGCTPIFVLLTDVDYTAGSSACW